VFLQIGAVDPATQVGGQVRHDVVDALWHRGEGIVGSEDDVVAAENSNSRVQRIAVVCQ
jgi:hypothetical protein